MKTFALALAIVLCASLTAFADRPQFPAVRPPGTHCRGSAGPWAGTDRIIRPGDAAIGQDRPPGGDGEVTDESLYRVSTANG